MYRALSLLGVLLLCVTATASDMVLDLSRHLGDTPALVVVVSNGDKEDQRRIARLAEQKPWIVFCHTGTTSGTEQIRQWASSAGLLGTRVYVADGWSDSLWLADEMADAVWIEPTVSEPPPDEEVARVLRPGGVATGPGTGFVKPAMSGTDEWRHPYYHPNNNVVSNDAVARLPGELRFQTQPVFAAMPNQTLFAGGRVFFFSGHIAFHEREEPLLNKLTVLNAYNGLTLWNRSLDPRYVVHNLTKLATESEVVFAEGQTLWVLDAATGRTQGEFRVPAEANARGDTDWKWIAQEGDVLWAACGPPDARVAEHRGRAQMGHWPWSVANEHYRGLVDNFGSAGTLVAFRYPSMEPLWMISEPEPFDVRFLCMEGGRIFQMAPRRFLAARDAASGESVWRHTPETSRPLFEAIGEALKRQGWGLGWATYCAARAAGDVVCLAGPPMKRTVCISLDEGELLWTSEDASPHPFFLEDGLYLMPRVAGDSAVCRKVDPRTGQVLRELRLGGIGSCTRLTATAQQFFYRPGGGEGRTVCVDLLDGELLDYNGIVRPGCFDGVVPAHGRLYWMPLACDCWQVHGTISMAPRSPVADPKPAADFPLWRTPSAPAPAAANDWPMFRCDAAGSATVPAAVPGQAQVRWRRRLPNHRLTAPICVQGRVYVGAADGLVRALDASDGRLLWSAASHAAVLHPPACWKGRLLVGSCDGSLVCVDARDGSELGTIQVAPERRFINIMNQLMSAWPLAGGVVVSDDGIAYTAAGCTAADGTVAVAVDVTDGRVRWRQAYTLERQDPALSFGVQSNLLLHEKTLFINGGAPVGIVALEASTGADPRVVAQLEAGREMFLEPDGRPLCGGRELFSSARTRTTIFKRHQGRVYFRISDRHLALVDGRLFCARTPQALDAIVQRMNQDPRTGEKLGGLSVPWDVMQLPIGEGVIWATDSSDVRGLAVGTDGVVVLHEDSAEAFAADGQSLWIVSLPAAPVRWGIALTGNECIVTLTDGRVICLADTGPQDAPEARN